MKGGAKVVVEPHRFPGVFIARGKEDALCTLNMNPGKAVYGEKLVKVDVSASSWRPALRLASRYVRGCRRNGSLRGPRRCVRRVLAQRLLRRAIAGLAGGVGAAHFAGGGHEIRCAPRVACCAGPAAQCRCCLSSSLE